MRQIFLLLSLAVLTFGLYLQFFYDVPDSQITTNFYVSWFLIIAGGTSALMNVFWSQNKRRSPY